jgi:membrane protein implicated in regulation of membrane protease activity
VAIYIGALLFGGVLILASIFGAGEHSVDVHSGDVSDPHAEGSGNALLAALIGIRFWSFGAAFFGLTGLLLRVSGAATLAAPVGAVVGAAAGFTASLLFRKMTREAVGRVGDASTLVGREGRLLLPVARTQQGKVRVAQPGGGHMDLVAAVNGGDDEALAAGDEVIVVEVRGTVAIVTRAPGARQ